MANAESVVWRTGPSDAMTDAMTADETTDETTDERIEEMIEEMIEERRDGRTEERRDGIAEERTTAMTADEMIDGIILLLDVMRVGILMCDAKIEIFEEEERVKRRPLLGEWSLWMASRI
jgi:hypothetical protein